MKKIYDGSSAHNIKSKDEKKKRLLQLLGMRKDKRYRGGMVQCAVSFDIINNAEACKLVLQISNSERCCLWLEND